MRAELLAAVSLETDLQIPRNGDADKRNGWVAEALNRVPHDLDVYCNGAVHVGGRPTG
ncbi:hypothetical protein [Bradyrhizobium daqingense]|uniref:hypothetical protein n=1 Tax=Bradyrhizobium daqingense TaxID=993502 RepID=UPI003836BE67